ncbi:TlpA disulfide reductase family protein [Solitalea koreensis]|uniref:Peroxiredoxin n=1 Tax=Solitalea koreensis TaxID=543615 RepID=A0A521EMN8_9SPHI|nr:TlpA disulfide reductase family protein [Solitalea koreensis]SMO84370.1 Peroxiredoxin [Solitalea koreensis]
MKLKFLCLLALPLMLNTANAQTKKGFVINGQLANLQDGANVYLFSHNIETNKTDTISKAVASKGAFKLTGSVAAPELHYLVIQNLRGGFPFFVENNNLTLKGNVDSLGKIAVTGSKSQDDLASVNSKLSALGNEMNALYPAFQEAKKANDTAKMDEINKKADAIQVQQQNVVKDFAATHPASYASPYVVMVNIRGLDPAVYQPIYDKFSANVKQSTFGKQLNKSLVVLAKTAIGKPAPEFTGKTPDGKDLALKDVVSKGKITMIDFWASWCGPCRAENPNVVKLYQQYHEKGFNVIGVSLDRDADKWEKAIADDNLTWNHVSDLKFWSSEFAALYGVQAVPATFLLDAKGIIIGKNLRGEKLAEKLAELLGPAQ